MIEQDSGSNESTVFSVDLLELITRKIWAQSDDDSSTCDARSEEPEGSEESEHEHDSDAKYEHESDDSNMFELLHRENEHESSDDAHDERHQQKSVHFKDEMQKLKAKEEIKEELLGSEMLIATKA